MSATLPFLDHPLPLAFAHRGGGLEAEENTAEAFERAVALGYRYLETDVQATRDGVAVVFHDDTLTRLTGVRARVGDLTWRELAAIRTHGGNAILRLDDLLGAWPEARVNLDPKSDAAVAPMAEAIRRGGALARVGVGSFRPARVRRLRALLGEGLCWSPSHAGVFRLWLACRGLPAGACPFPAVQVPARWSGIPVVTPAFVAEAGAQGAQVHVWTVDEAAEMERLLDMGVHGLMTDRPSLLKAVLTRRGQWTGG